MYVRLCRIWKVPKINVHVDLDGAMKPKRISPGLGEYMVNIFYIKIEKFEQLRYVDSCLLSTKRP